MRTGGLEFTKQCGELVLGHDLRLVSRGIGELHLHGGVMSDYVPLDGLIQRLSKQANAVADRLWGRGIV